MQGICSNQYVFVAIKESEKNISGMDGEYELGIHRIKGQRPPTAFTRLIVTRRDPQEHQHCHLAPWEDSWRTYLVAVLQASIIQGGMGCDVLSNLPSLSYRYVE